MQIVPYRFVNRLCSLLFFFSLTMVSYSQEAQITFSSGNEFTVSSNGLRKSYYGGSAEARTISLKKNDILQTSGNTFVELRLEPGGTKIKIAENTSLACIGQEYGEMTLSFSLLYGRIRISNEGLWQNGGGNTVFIQAGKAETIFYRGDAGIDYIVRPGISNLSQGEPVLTVYNFSGATVLRPLSWLTSNASSSGFQINEYESLSMEIINSLSYMERKAMDNGIINYWNRYNFSGGTALHGVRQVQSATPQYYETVPAPPQVYVDQTPIVIERIEYVYPETPPAIIEYVFPDNPLHKRLFRIKNCLISSGMFFTVAGISMQIAGNYGIPKLNNETNKLITGLGYLPLTMGLILSGASLVINPRNVVEDVPK